MILAGGQGSRLGFDKAKGMYNINMPSNKSLFEYISNRFLSSQIVSKKIIEKYSTNLNKEFKPCTLMKMITN